MKRINYIAALALLIGSAAATAAPIDYKFDTLTRFDTGPNTTGPSPNITFANLRVTGVLANDTTPTTLTFTVTVAFTDFVSRCVPMFLTMMEKPGRYWLNLTLDSVPTFPSSQMLNCGLEVKS